MKTNKFRKEWFHTQIDNFCQREKGQNSLLTFQREHFISVQQYNYNMLWTDYILVVLISSHQNSDMLIFQSY